MSNQYVAPHIFYLTLEVGLGPVQTGPTRTHPALNLANARDTRVTGWADPPRFDSWCGDGFQLKKKFNNFAM